MGQVQTIIRDQTPTRPLQYQAFAVVNGWQYCNQMTKEDFRFYAFEASDVGKTLDNTTNG